MHLDTHKHDIRYIVIHVSHLCYEFVHSLYQFVPEHYHDISHAMIKEEVWCKGYCNIREGLCGDKLAYYTEIILRTYYLMGFI